MSSIRQRSLPALAILIGLVAALLILEVVFRILPTSDTPRTQPVNNANPYLHYEPNRTLTMTTGRFFEIVARKRTNNYGFLSDLDYARSASKKLVVIGDSYVEAMQVANKDSIQGVLNTKGGLEVYGIGASGSPLSQYLAYAEFAITEFSPAALCIVVVGNDFDESLLDYNNAQGFHLLRKAGADYELVLVDYEPSALKKALRHSALGRYMFMNLSLGVGIQHWGQFFTGGSALHLPQEYVGNTASKASKERIDKSREVVEFFLKAIRTKAGGLPIVFVLDGMRPNLYSESGLLAAKESYFDLMRNYFMERAAAHGFEVVDLNSIFLAHYRQYGRRFEFPTNGHWNELGHKLAADAVANTEMFRNFVK